MKKVCVCQLSPGCPFFCQLCVCLPVCPSIFVLSVDIMSANVEQPMQNSIALEAVAIVVKSFCNGSSNVDINFN